MTPYSWVTSHLNHANAYWHEFRPIWLAANSALLCAMAGWLVYLDTGAVLGGILGASWWDTTQFGQFFGGLLEALLLTGFHLLDKTNV
jgi:hypothetical protein